MGKTETYTKIVGHISKDVARKYNLYDYEGQEIIQDLTLTIHASKHRFEFKDDDSYYTTLDNIELIIDNPYFVYHDPHKNSLLYFKELKENVCVVVQLNLRKNKKTYVATVYPVSTQKIQKYKEKSYIINR